MRRLVVVVGLLLAFAAAPAGAGAKTKPRAVASRPRGGQGVAVGGLGLSATLASDHFKPGDPIPLTVELVNVGKQPRDVLSHIATHETHWDWYEITLSYPVPSEEGCAPGSAGVQRRTITLMDSRDKSAPVTVTLGAGKKLAHVIDVADWAARSVNGSQPLEPGFYKLTVRYHVDKKREKGVWSGSIDSRAVGFVVDGTPPASRCATNPGWDRF